LPQLQNNQRIELIKILDTELMPAWESAYRFQLTDEMSSFAERIIGVGKKFQLPDFESFGDQFLDALESFELETMESCLKNFPKFINELRNQLTKL